MYLIVFIVSIGLFFWLCNLGVLQLERDWPLLIIIIGIFILLSIFSRSKKYKIIRDLEKGNISAEEAEKRLKKAV
jgi:hypothetical protein